MRTLLRSPRSLRARHARSPWSRRTRPAARPPSFLHIRPSACSSWSRRIRPSTHSARSPGTRPCARSPQWLRGRRYAHLPRSTRLVWLSHMLALTFLSKPSRSPAAAHVPLTSGGRPAPSLADMTSPPCFCLSIRSIGVGSPVHPRCCILWSNHLAHHALLLLALLALLAHLALLAMKLVLLQCRAPGWLGQGVPISGDQEAGTLAAASRVPECW